MKRFYLSLCSLAISGSLFAQYSPRPVDAGVGAGTGDALVADPLSQFAATTSAEFKGVINDELAPDGASSKVIMTLGSLSIASGKTGTISNTLTFTGTDASSVAFGAGGTVLYSGGAGGTPSSLTLTNATSLPVAGITSSTSTALGVGSLELGAASDTTLSRASAGVLAVEGTNVLLSGGSIGTPSSGTATNITGLPISGLTSSTSTALGVGSLELGAASDTTLSRASAGVLAIEGVNVILNGGALGTPASGNLSNATALPISGLTSSTSTALGLGSIELGAASDTTLSRASAGVLAVEGSNVLVSGGALGTPASGTATNITGLPVAGITASTSTALGVGSIELGAASDTTIARSGAGAITVESVAVPTISSTNTLTNKRVTPRAGTTADSASLTVDSDSFDVYTVTALAQACTINAPSGTPTEGQKLLLRFKDNATARALTFTTGSSGAFRASSDLALPTTTTLSKTLYATFTYNATDSRWDLMAKLDNF